MAVRIERKGHYVATPPTAGSQPHLLQLSEDEGAGSEVYVTSAAYRTPSEISRGGTGSVLSNNRDYSVHQSGYAASGYAPSRAPSRGAGVSVITTAAPNPLCPDVRGICCLMLLLNLALALIALGFVLVIQFQEMPVVWILGFIFLVSGFATLIGSLIYCVVVCREAPSAERLYWSHRWQGGFGAKPPPEVDVHYRDSERFSERY